MSTNERIADDRVTAARQALAERGVHGATVEVEGHEREIAAVRVPAGEWERMMGPEGASIADAVKATGFRYVALDLAPEDEPPPDEASEADDADDADDAEMADPSFNVMMGCVALATSIAGALIGLAHTAAPMLLAIHVAARALICLGAGYLGARTMGNRALVASTFLGLMLATTWTVISHLVTDAPLLGAKDTGYLLIFTGAMAIAGTLAGAAIARIRDRASPQRAV